MFHEYEYTPRVEDWGLDGHITEEAILSMLENAANSHSMSVGDKRIEGNSPESTWIQLSWNIRIHRYPKNNERLKVTTWTCGEYTKVKTLREFNVRDENNQVVIEALGEYTLFDIERNRPCRISEEVLYAYKPENKSEYSGIREKLKEPDKYDEIYLIQMRKGDIDYNGHVHNTKYLIYGLEMLPTRDIDNIELGYKDILINYKKSVMPGDVIVAKKHKDKRNYTIGIYRDNNELCALLSFRK